MIVVFTIEEGEVYEFGEVILSGNMIFSDDELRQERFSEPGERFSQTELEKDKFEILNLYRAQGYLYSQPLSLKALGLPVFSLTFFVVFSSAWSCSALLRWEV